MANTIEGSSIQNVQENYAKYADMFNNESNNEVSIDTFYQLLIAEMQNQDPLEPMSNTEFISQMASFTSLQSQKDALYYSQSNYASSLVGKTVIVAQDSGTDKLATTTGVVESVNLSGGSFEIVVDGKSYSLSNIMEIVNPTTASATESGSTYASDLIGKTVTVQALDANGATIVDEGVVTAVEVKDGVPSIIVNGLAYSTDNIVKIEDTTATAEPVSTADEASTAGPVNAADEAAQTGGGEEEADNGTTTQTTTSTSADGTVTTTTVRTYDADGNLIDTDTTATVNQTAEDDIADLTDSDVLSMFDGA